MQKAQKLAIKSIVTFLLIFTQTILSQQNDMIEKTIENFRYKKDSMTCSLKSIDIKNVTSDLKSYYDFKTKNRPFMTVLNADENGEPIVDSLILKKSIKFWKKKYSVLDSLFTIKEIKHIIDLELPQSKEYVFDNKNVCKDCDCVNRISKPFFNSTKNAVFILHREYSKYITNKSTAYIYRKSDGNWILFSKINSFGM